MIHINLMPKSPTPETIERLQNAQSGLLKFYIYHLKTENQLQQKLINAYRVYSNFMERRLNSIQRKGQRRFERPLE